MQGQDVPWLSISHLKEGPGDSVRSVDHSGAFHASNTGGVVRLVVEEYHVLKKIYIYIYKITVLFPFS